MTQSAAQSRRLVSRGALLVVGLFALGGAVLWGLFQAPRATSPPAPAGAAWGVPDRPLRFVTCDVALAARDLDAIAADVVKSRPDFVLLQGVESRDVVRLARALGMQPSHHPNAYQPAVNLGGSRMTSGNVIFSRHPLHEAGPIPDSGGASFGVWAVSVVDERKFFVASVRLPAGAAGKEGDGLIAAWRQRGQQPLVVGGDWAGLPPAEATLSAARRHLFTSRDWSVIRGQGFAIDFPPGIVVTDLTASPRPSAASSASSPGGS